MKDLDQAHDLIQITFLRTDLLVKFTLGHLNVSPIDLALMNVVDHPLKWIVLELEHQMMKLHLRNEAQTSMIFFDLSF